MAKVHLYQYEHRGERSYSEYYNGDKRDIGVSHADDVFILSCDEEYLMNMKEEDKAVSRALAKIWAQYAADGTASWPAVNTKPGLLTVQRIMQNAVFQTVEIEDAGNTKFWKSLPIDENLPTPVHNEL